MRRRALPSVLLAAGLTVGACSSGPPSSTAPAGTSASASSTSAPSTAAVCAAADALRQSLARLQGVEVSKSGLGALQTAFAEVRTDVDRLATAARGQHAAQVDQLRSDAQAVENALKAAVSNPANRTEGAVPQTVSTLVTDGRAFLDDLGPSC
jgi:outer membrane murein-binding lipoprotein Lpp